MNMKKNVIIACTVLLLAGSAKAQITYFSTGFDEGMPSAFTLHDVDGRTPSTDMQNLGFAVGVPWVVYEEGNDGNMVACSTSWYKNAGKSDDWMVTGAIAIESEKTVLSWRSRASDKDYRDGYKIYISEKGTAVEDFDKSAPLFEVSKESYSWTEHVVDLSAYAGKTVYIAFVNDSQDKNCLYVDDIFVGVESNVGLTTNLGRVIQQYGDVAVSGQVFATVEKSITSYKVGYRINGETYEQEFDGTLEPGKKTDFVLDKKFNISRNQTSEYEVWIKSGTDSTGVKGRVSAYPRKLVSEEVTGTWCGYCVRGIVAMKEMNEKYPDSFIGIAIHCSSAAWTDAMSFGVEDYHDLLFSRCNLSGYPRCVYNRNTMYSIDPGDMETYYKQIMDNSTNNCGIQLNASYDEATNEIIANTDIYFAADIDKADYRLAYVLVENNVHRTNEDIGVPEGKPTGYEQNNYYADNAMGEMGGFENLPSTIPADQMWYNDVARTIYPDYNGVSGVIPETIKEGDHFSYSCSFEIPKNVLEKKNTELIVLLINKNGIIDNADKVAIDGLTTGIYTVRDDNVANEDDAYYNVNGMRVNYPGKGIYIHKGKKILK